MFKGAIYCRKWSDGSIDVYKRDGSRWATIQQRPGGGPGGITAPHGGRQ